MFIDSSVVLLCGYARGARSYSVTHSPPDLRRG